MRVSLFSKLHSMTLTQTVASLPAKFLSALRSIIPGRHRAERNTKSPLCAVFPSNENLALTIEKTIRIKSLMKGAQTLYEFNSHNLSSTFDITSTQKDFHRYEEWSFTMGLHEDANTTKKIEYNTSFRLSRRGKNLRKILEAEAGSGGAEAKDFMHHMKRLEDRVLKLVARLVTLDSGAPFERVRPPMEFSLREVEAAIENIITWRFGDDDNDDTNDDDDEDEEFFDAGSVGTEVEDEGVYVTYMDAFE
ncbi:hypothetical protein BDW74DRAFT_178080 [Aspergillus multicolor]|uniref:uncharacterized protein n=1 Tax=Aspergillus multicolor TaxID=41759 RepID=UPI003CCD7190